MYLKLLKYIGILKQTLPANDQPILNSYYTHVKTHADPKIFAVIQEGLKNICKDRKADGVDIPSYDEISIDEEDKIFLTKESEEDMSKVVDPTDMSYTESAPEDLKNQLFLYQKEIGKALRDKLIWPSEHQVEELSLGVIDGVNTGITFDNIYLGFFVDSVVQIVQDGDSIDLSFLKSVNAEYKHLITESDRKFKHANEILEDPDIYNMLVDYTSSHIIGNKQQLKALLIDLIMTFAPPIQIRSPDEVRRYIRAQSAIILCGPTEAGKSRICDFIHKVLPESELLSTITYEILMTDLLGKISHNVVIMREAEGVLPALTAAKPPRGGDKLTPTLREIIEDQSVRWQHVDRKTGNLFEHKFDVFTTFIFATVHKPTEPQIKTRFKVYELDDCIEQTAEVLDQTIDGLIGTLKNPTLSYEEVQFIFRTLRVKIGELSGVKFSLEQKEKLKDIENKLVYAAVPNNAVFPDGNQQFTKEQLYRRNLNQIDEDLINKIIRLSRNTDISVQPIKRRFEEVVRFIVGHCYLHVNQRKQEEGYLIVEDADITASKWLLNVFIEELENDDYLANSSDKNAKTSVKQERRHNSKKSVDQKPFRMTYRMKEVLDAIKEASNNGTREFTPSEISKASGVNEGTTKIYMKKLDYIGVIKPYGNFRGYYQFVGDKPISISVGND